MSGQAGPWPQRQGQARPGGHGQRLAVTSRTSTWGNRGQASEAEEMALIGWPEACCRRPATGVDRVAFSSWWAPPEQGESGRC